MKWLVEDISFSKEAGDCFAYETHRLHDFVLLNKPAMVHGNTDKLSYWGQHQACNACICVPGPDRSSYRIVAPPDLLIYMLDMRICVPCLYSPSACVQQICRLSSDANVYHLLHCL